MKTLLQKLLFLLLITASFSAVLFFHQAQADNTDQDAVDLNLNIYNPIVVTPPDRIPSYLTIVSGNNQISKSRNLAPLVVKIFDQNNIPMSGVAIDFAYSSVPNGANNYSINHATVATDQNGLASVDAILGDKAGTYQIVARTGTLSVTFNEVYSPETIIVPPPTPPNVVIAHLIIVSGNNQTSSKTDLDQPFVIRVLDQNNNPIAGIKVDFYFSLYPDGATGYSTNPISVITDKDGYARVFVTLGDKPGNSQITAKTGDLTVVFSAKYEVTTASTIADTIENTAKIISQFTNPVATSEIAKIVNTPFAFATVIWALLSPLIANAPIALPWLTYFINWIMGFFQIIPRKRWGTVYDSVSRRPVKGVDVSVFNTQYNQLVESQSTDDRGRFIINVKPGKYYLMVSANKYSFPSEYDLVGYRGKPITVGSSNTQIIVDIPIDPIGKRTYIRRFSFPKLSRVLDSIYYPMMILGTLVSVAIAFNQGSLFNIAVLGLYLIVWSSELVKIVRNHTFGIVYDTGTRKPLDYAIVRIYNADNRKLLSTKISTIEGHFNILLGPGHYILVATKDGYQTETHELRIHKDNYLNDNIFMKTATSNS